MPTTLPVWTETLDNAFLETWYEIRDEIKDQITEATVIWALLKAKGCMVSQRGGRDITRNVQYALGPTPVNVEKGDTLPTGETETDTMARFTFRKKVTHVQRSIFQDRENAGKFKLRDYVKRRLMQATEAMKQQDETDMLGAFAATAETTSKAVQGLNELVPPYANATSNTYGLLNRPSAYSANASGNGVYAPTSTGTNPWWGPKYKQVTLPIEVNLVEDMKVLYNTLGNNQQDVPDAIISDQNMFEVYQTFGLDKIQLAGNTKLLDLGFQTIKFMGTDIVWTPNMIAGDMLFLCTKHIELVYDPGMWFDMDEFKPVFNSGDRVAHIFRACNLISDCLRKQGRLTSQTVS